MGANGEQWDSGDQITPARMNQKTVTADTGANCNADTKYAGKIFMPSSSNGSLTADIPAYVKADASTLEDFLTKTSAQTPTNKTLLSDVPRRRYYLTGLTGLTGCRLERSLLRAGSSEPARSSSSVSSSPSGRRASRVSSGSPRKRFRCSSSETSFPIRSSTLFCVISDTSRPGDITRPVPAG